ncbi:MAG: hypothetical protein WAS27_01685, partial [Candidatus Saccharimonadales bacterium]
MSDNSWTIIVLEKLRNAVIDGELISEKHIDWQYDSEDTLVAENKELLILSIRGVFRASNFNDNGASVYRYDNHKKGLYYDGGVDLAQIRIDTDRRVIIDKFDSARYEIVCAEYGLDPYKARYIASLKLKGIGTPLVHIGEATYTFHSMQADSYKEQLFTYLCSHPNISISLDTIKAELGFSEVEYMSKLVENS